MVPLQMADVRGVPRVPHVAVVVRVREEVHSDEVRNRRQRIQRVSAVLSGLTGYCRMLDRTRPAPPLWDESAIARSPLLCRNPRAEASCCFGPCSAEIVNDSVRTQAPSDVLRRL